LVTGDTNGVDDVFVRNIDSSTTVRASISEGNAQGNVASLGASMHPTVDLVAFQSRATNLVTGDTNAVSDIFVKNLSNGQVRRVSTTSGGIQGNGASTAAAIAVGDVVFLSDATNLVTDDTNGVTDGFINLSSGGLTRRVTNTGLDGDDRSEDNNLSSLGRFVVFESSATNLILGDTNGFSDIFQTDVHGPFTQRVSVSSTQAQANDSSFEPSVSADGRYVAFQSFATNLVTNDTNGHEDIFVRDVLGGTTTRVSVSGAGAQANSVSRLPMISGNGRYVVFLSWASNLVVGDTNAQPDVFVHDRQTSQTVRVSLNSSEQQGDGESDNPAINFDGSFVAFSSGATNLVANDTNASTDVFLRDIAAGTTQRLSVSTSGTQSNGNSSSCDISDDGSRITFSSVASNLVASDTNGVQDIFIRNRANSTTIRASVSTAGVQSNGLSHSPSISGDGMSVAFGSKGTNLVAIDLNDETDIYVRSLSLNTTRIVSVDALGEPNVYPCASPSISVDGLAVSFWTLSPLTPLDRNFKVDVYLNDARLAAETLTRVRGVVEEGSHGSTIFSDNIYYILRPGVTFTTAQAPIELVGEATGSGLSPTRLEFAIEFHSTALAIRQVIEMYNFDTNSYEIVDTRQSTLSDGVVVIAVTANAGRFVDNAGRMRTRISYKASGPVFSYPWRTRIDHIRWTQF
jgi:Tol biopolymer transport system component